MLCTRCEEIFAFSRTDELLELKEDAGFHSQEPSIHLQKELDKYKQQLELSKGSTSCPPPWSVYSPATGDDGYHTYEIWHDQTARGWLDVQRSAASNGCRICVSLMDMFDEKITDSINDSGLIGAYWALQLKTLLPSHISFCVLESGGSSRFVMGANIEVAIRELHSVPVDPVLRLSTVVGAFTGGDSCLDLLTDSLHFCLQNHLSCKRETDDWMPTRLLDVRSHSTSGDSIRLVDTDAGLVSNDYLTLSHVWGSKPLLKLTTENEGAFRKCIEMDAIPQRYADAISIARRLQIPYLWIDSLCIIQNDEQDWAHEAVQMDKVYRNGVCNIAACDSLGPTESLFSNRNPRACAAFTTTHEYFEQTVEFTLLPDWVELTRDHAPLFRRAWILQERMLSTRVMYFSKFPFWECNETLRIETYRERDGLQVTPFENLPRPTKPTLNKNNIAQTILSWYAMVAIYNPCHLTFASDKLVAMSGLAKRFSQVIEKPYFAGLWGGEHFVGSLLWKFIEGGVSTSVEYRAPSWSWASKTGRIFHHGQAGSLYRELRLLIKIDSIRTVPKSDDPFGQLIGGEIRSKGTLFEITKNNLAEINAGDLHCLDDAAIGDGPQSIYFLPLQEVHDPDFDALLIFTGLYLRVKEGSEPDEHIYERVGADSRMIAFDEDVRNGRFLSTQQWQQLLDPQSYLDAGEDIIIV
ncbi:heterokaryon incompatibility protein-domain-containing protein [Massariosphaeria phaeospora]|uniref:Heterokaryon incompatibility protein-domain-containing protein n=1 Tax=Massariosphaeria phaeospora TaxID=100035 RepID=A0A7C8I092_9PLEO|nr:heterokaryon incompatibility protein-domain-containing protein [Massariosphaeria phaeospora]